MQRACMKLRGIAPYALALLAVGVLAGAGSGAAREDPPLDPAAEEEGDLLSEPTPSVDGAYGFVAEVLDSSFVVGPAEFLGLDLPTRSGESISTHLFGTVSVAGSRSRDIIVRVFRAGDYANWLKKRGGVQAAPFYNSGRARDITLDLDLPPGEPVVLLLDNGYSVRTPKKVRCQLQIRFGEAPPGAARAPDAETGETQGREGATGEYDEILPPPRNNEEEAVPPPPPPPPDAE